MTLRLALFLLLSLPMLASAQSVTFGHRAAERGDTIDQAMRVEMRLDQTGRRGDEVLDQTKNTQDRDQRRRVTATEIVDGRVVAATVHFFEARSAHNGEATVEPVVGKAYVCRRKGDTLEVTTPEGLVPPITEYALVSRAMATLGTASPLAEFLAGKTIAVGESLDLPAKLARQALGFDSEMGEVNRFGLKLDAVEESATGPIARFTAEIEASGSGSQQMGLIVSGAFGIEARSCRVVSADLSGPLVMSVVVGDYTIDAKGKMRLALASKYRDAR